MGLGVVDGERERRWERAQIKVQVNGLQVREKNWNLKSRSFFLVT
jgi:hypothetical protein